MSSEQDEGERSHELYQSTSTTNTNNNNAPPITTESENVEPHIGTSGTTTPSHVAGTSSPSHLTVPDTPYSRAPSHIAYASAQIENHSVATSCYTSENNGQSGSSISFGSYTVTDTAASSTYGGGGK